MIKVLKKGQSVLEYVIILAVVCGALVVIGVMAAPAVNLFSPSSVEPRNFGE
ncbi:MAG: hypothetical protein PHY35_03850 [Candidatus Omnitrophica bacterium]|nr:hypothetical protein [Candidatus Omnitrophota bacterium]